MKQKRLFILLAILALVISSLACGLFSGGDEAANEVPPSDQPVESAPSDEPVDSLPAGEAEYPDPPPSVDLGDEYRSEEGGYAFNPIPGYSLEGFFGLASMEAPDADPDLGPFFFMIGSTNEEEKTNEDIYAEFAADMPEGEITIIDKQTIIVDGVEGLLVDIAGNQEGEDIAGRVVILLVTPTQQFTMFASAPQDRWHEVEPLFDAVLASVYFFEPQEMDLSEGLDESGEGEETAEADIPLLGEMGALPSAYDELPPGGFVFLLASTTQGLPTIVDQGTIQDQSTSAEYVIGLVSEDQRNTVTLFIPLNVAPGVLMMTPYDTNAATKGPGAAVHMGLSLYTNIDGIIMIEEVKENTISGMFACMVIDESGAELSVTGFFNELPLGAP